MKIFLESKVLREKSAFTLHYANPKLYIVLQLYSCG